MRAGDVPRVTAMDPRAGLGLADRDEREAIRNARDRAKPGRPHPRQVVLRIHQPAPPAQLGQRSLHGWRGRRKWWQVEHPAEVLILGRALDRPDRTG